MTSVNLLPLREIVIPKPTRPNLVENLVDALANPDRTVRDYLFTSSIRGYFDRIFQDIKEGRGGGYWVQAEYGGGKTHFLATLLSLLGDADGATKEKTWGAVGDSGMRSEWESLIRPRRVLGAQLSLMGTAPVLGAQQPKLVELIDRAVVGALTARGMNDPGIGAGAEVLRAFAGLDPAIRAAIEGAFVDAQGMSVNEGVAEVGEVETAVALLKAAEAKGIALTVNLQTQDHFRQVLAQLQSLGFEGLIVVIDEYYSRQGVLSAEQLLEDGSTLETIGYQLGRSQGLPIYLVVASQAEIPAKLGERVDSFVLLRDRDQEYSQIVCKRIMDYHATVEEQAVLYHGHFSRSFQFLRRSGEAETRLIFPFQPAVFRFLRELVSSPRVQSLPSARFAIGSAYDALTQPGALDVTRFLTPSDLLVGSLADALLEGRELADWAAALRQARDYVDATDWSPASFQALASRLLNHLFLHSIVSDGYQNVDQIVEATLVAHPAGLLSSRQIAQTILRQLQNCEQIESKDGSWRFASKVSAGQQFEPLFQSTRRKIQRTDPRIRQGWVELLTAPVSATAGAQTYLSPLVSGINVAADYCGISFPGRAVYGQGNLSKHLGDLERIKEAERVRIVIVGEPLTSPPLITDPAIAVVAPGELPEAAVDDLRGLLACGEIRADYELRVEQGAEHIVAQADAKARDLTKAIIGRQKEAFRSGEICTKDGLPLQPKHLFSDTLAAGLTALAQQLAKSAYDKASAILNTQHIKKARLTAADASKVFDAVFGGVQEPKSKGAAEQFGALLGLASPNDPAKLTANAGPGPDALAQEIAKAPTTSAAELYDVFCSEPYGLPSYVVDLLIFACVGLAKPCALEVRPAAGVAFVTRDRRTTAQPVRSSQLRLIQWPEKGLRGCVIQQSKEITWNDFAPVAQAIDPARFILTTVQSEIDAQEKEMSARLRDIGAQTADVRATLDALANAGGGKPDDSALQALQRLRGLASLGDAFSREATLAYVRQTWDEANPVAIKADIEKLRFLTQLVGEGAKLSGDLTWYRSLLIEKPAAMHGEMEISQALLPLEYLTSGPGQLASGKKALSELRAAYMAKLRPAHQEFVLWQARQRDAMTRAERRLPTLGRLNRIRQLGPPDLPDAEREVNRIRPALEPCQSGNELDIGSGLACVSCRFRLGQMDGLQPVGERAEKEVNDAIKRRTSSLAQGLIAEAIRAAGDQDLTAILLAAQAGQVEKIIEGDLLSDELVNRLNRVLARAKQQTVPAAQVYEFLAECPHITEANLEDWLARLRRTLLAAIEDAKQQNPGQEVTLLLRSAKNGD